MNDLDALRELLAKATPGPWKIECDWEFLPEEAAEKAAHFADHECCSIVAGLGDDRMRIYDEGGHDNADAELIVAAVNALPNLLDRLETAEYPED